jgi:ABC-type multidrug transport system fused ATPase/permease subunit
MDKKQLLKPYMRQFYKGNGWRFALALAVTLVLTASTMMVSWLIQVIIDLATGADVGLSFSQVVLLTVTGILLEGFAYFLAYHSKPRFIAKCIGQYKEYVFTRLCQKGIGAFSSENSSLYISALSNDAATVEMNYLANVFIIVENSAICIGALVLMFYYSPLLTMLSIVLALLPLAVSICTGNLVAKAEKTVSDKNETYMSTLKDSLVGFAVIKSFRAEVQMCRIFAEAVKEVTDAKTFRKKMSILVNGLSASSGTILQFSIFLIGAYLALNGHGLSAGSVLVFVQLLNFVINPIGAIPQALAEIKASKTLIAKVAEALESNVREEGLECKKELVTGITVEGLSFGYEEEKPVLQDVNFTFDAGKSYAIVGASGSGKSTLLNLLMASHDDYTGSICYDEAELRQISSDSLYEMVSVVQQNVFIFNASIRDNITMFSDFPREEVDRAIELSGLSKLIAERGEDYLCGENGSGLSGGEKQRISIARSLLKKAQVLLVDEATAALDAQTAFQVSNAILDLNDLTRIVVTHSLDENLLKRYDCVLTLKNGSVTEYGSFDELMAKKGYFYSLFTVSQ